MRRLVSFIGFIAWMGISAGLWHIADSTMRQMPPQTIVNAVTSRYPGATICRAHLRRGTDIYELIVRKAGRAEAIKMRVTLLGKVERIERALRTDEVPLTVQRMMARRYSQERIDRITKIQAPGKPVRYEIRVAAPRPGTLQFECNAQGEVTRVVTDIDSNTEKASPKIESVGDCV